MVVSISDYVIVDLKDYIDEIKFAFTCSSEKSKHNNTQNTWQKQRSNFKKFTDLFPGDLAKNIVRVKIKDILNLEVEDYDKVRIDEFKENDKYDLKYNNKLIEVKSSNEKYTNDINKINTNRRFMVYSDRQSPDISFQVFYIFENSEGQRFFNDMEKMDETNFLLSYKIEKLIDFVKLFIKYSPKLYIVGFITKEYIENKKKEPNSIFSYQTRGVIGDKNRNYLQIFIQEGISLKTLKNYL